MGKFNENIFITRVHVHQAIGLRLTLVNSTLCMNLNPIRWRSLYQNDAQAILRLKSATVSKSSEEQERGNRNVTMEVEGGARASD